jgi:transposase
MMNLAGKLVYLACGRTDMRKSINGFATIVEQSFDIDLFTDALFAFCNGNRDRIKILFWDGNARLRLTPPFASLSSLSGFALRLKPCKTGDGFWLLFKRLEKGRFRWPAEREDLAMALTSKELAILFDGAKIE